MPTPIYQQTQQAMQQEFNRALQQAVGAQPGTYPWGMGFQPNYGSVMPQGSFQMGGGRWMIPNESGGFQSQPQQPRFTPEVSQDLVRAYQGGWNPSPSLWGDIWQKVPGLYNAQIARDSAAYDANARGVITPEMERAMRMNATGDAAWQQRMMQMGGGGAFGGYYPSGMPSGGGGGVVSGMGAGARPPQQPLTATPQARPPIPQSLTPPHPSQVQSQRGKIRGLNPYQSARQQMMTGYRSG